MEVNSLPPDPNAPNVYDSDALERVTANDNVTVADLSNASAGIYPIEALEVRGEGQAGHPTPAQPPPQFSSAGMGSVPFSRKRAATVSLGITIIVMIFTGGIMAVLVKGRLATKEAANRDVPTQGITLESSSTGVNPVELQKDQQSLLVSGDIITRGELQISSGGFVTTLRSQPLTGSQTITLPAESGTICLDSNNCNFVSQSQLAEVQGQIVDATTVNGNSGDITLQGVANQVTVTTNGQVITFTTPQNLHTAASVQFANLRLNGALRTDTIRTHTTGGDLTVTADTDQLFFVDRSRTFSFPAGGLASQTICTSQNNCNYGTGNGDIVNGGQIGPIVIGTDDASTLAFETNNTQRIILQSSGNVAIDTTTLTIDAVNNRVGVGTATPTAKLEVSGGSLLVTGTHTGTSEISVTGSGTRMFFDVGRSAFRAGAAVGDSWDPNWMGLYSAAFGENTRAGQWGFAAGQSTIAGIQAVAFGASSRATGWQSAAFGASTRANGQNSMATGICNVDRADLTSTPTATDALFMVGNGADSGLGDGSCASRSDAFTVLRNGSTTVNGGSLLVQGTHGGGNGISVTGAGTRMFFDVNKSAFRAGGTTTTYFDDVYIGQYSFAAGQNVLAGGNASVALGSGSRADWDRSVAIGFNARGGGIHAIALGYYTQAQAYASTTLGVCSAYSGSVNTWEATDQLFTIGNGGISGLGLGCNTRANALEMTKNGNLAVDTNTLFVDAVNNRIGIGTATPMSKLEVVESSTDTTAASISGATITVTDTGVVTTGTDNTSGLSVSVTRTGATGGTIQVIGGSFNAIGDTGGNSVAVGVQGLGVNTDDSVGVQGFGFISGSGARNSAIGVNGVTGTYFAAGSTITSAYGLQGGFAMDLGVATVTNVAGLNIKTATNVSGGVITNNYGIRVEDQTAGANDYGLYVAGADTYALWVDSGASRFDGTVQGYGHAAFGADAAIDDDATIIGALFGGATASSVVTVDENVTDFTKDMINGQSINITANPSSAYGGNINGQTIGLQIGGSESANAAVAQGTMLNVTDGVGLNSAIGSFNSVAVDTTGDINSVVVAEYNTTELSSAITGGVYGSLNVVSSAGANVVAGGLYNVYAAGITPDVIGIQVQLAGEPSSVIATAVGVNVAGSDFSGSNVTDSYGLRVGTMSGATNNYGLYVEGADTYALWVDDGISRLDGSLEVDTDTLFVDAANNRVGIGTATPSAKLQVVDSSTDPSPSTLTGAVIQVTDTGAVTSGYDVTAGLVINAVRTGASGGTFVTNGAHIESRGETTGDSLVQGVNAWGHGGDNSVGVTGSATVSGSGSFESIVGVQGQAQTFFNSDATVTSAYGLQGSVSNTSSGMAAIFTNGAGLNIKSAVNSGLGSIINNYGIRVENQTAGTSNYGLYIEGADTYGIWVDSGNSRFDGNVAINATTAANKLNLNTLTTADADAQLAVATDGVNNKGVVVQGVASQAADLFQAQDSTGAVLASISATGDLTVVTATINGTLTVNGNATINGHIISGNDTGSTTVAAGAAADCSASGLANISGNDTAGTITITTSTGACAAGTLATITFANAYGSAPEVVITPKDATGASLQYYNGNATTTAFTIDTGVGAATSTIYTYSYHVIE